METFKIWIISEDLPWTGTSICKGLICHGRGYEAHVQHFKKIWLNKEPKKGFKGKVKLNKSIRNTGCEDLRVSLGRPGPMLTVKIFPEILQTAWESWPFMILTCLVPPPPNPSFFTLNSSLQLKKKKKLLRLLYSYEAL